MAQVYITSNLKRFFKDIDQISIACTTVQEGIERLDQEHQGIQSYLLDDTGALRKHVNIFVNGTMVQDRKTLRDKVAAKDKIHIIQALSGG